MLKRVTILCAFAIFSLCRSTVVQAQPLETSNDQKKPGSDVIEELYGDERVKLSARMIEQIGEQLGIDAKGPRMNRILQGYYDPARAAKIVENVDSDEDPKTPQNIYLHIRGKEGIPFPAKDEVLLPIALTEEKIQKALDNYMGVMEEHAERNLKVPTLPECKKNFTTQTATNYKLPDQRSQVLVDLLFMRKEDVPLDPKEIFGASVLTRPYSTKSPNVDSLSAVGIGVTCLPTRMRATRSFVIRDEGLNALKNYDKDPHGKGEFHEYMKAKLGMAKGK